MFKPLFCTPLNLDHPLAQGLAGYWLFNENSGTNAWDATGNGNDGALINMSDPSISTSGWRLGPDGGALAFDGVNDYVNLFHNFTFAGRDHFSICMKVYIIGSGTSKFFYENKGMTTSSQFRVLVMYSAGSLYWYVTNAVGAQVSAVTTVSTNTWYDLVATYDGANLKIYLNGVLKNSAALTGLVESATGTTSDVTLGASKWGTAVDNRLSGLISSTSIYTRTLSAEEIAYLYTFPYAMFEEESYPAWMRGRVFNPAWARSANSYLSRMAA